MMARGQREQRVSFGFLLSLPDFTSALGSKKRVLIVVDQEGTRPMKRKRPLARTPPDDGPIGSNEACTVGEDDLAPISTLDTHDGKSEVDELKPSQSPAEPSADNDYILGSIQINLYNGPNNRM